MKIFQALLFIVLTSLSTGTALAQTQVIPAKAQSAPVLLKGAKAHLGNGTVIDNAVIAFDQGKITLVGPAASTSVDESKYDVYDVSGKQIYPGFIIANTQLGLVETSSLDDTRDAAETGENNANVRSIVAYNTDSELIPTMRFNGILMAQATPQGGLISGNSAIVQLDAWNWEDAAYKVDDAMHMSWPDKMLRPRWWMGESGTRANPDYEATVQQVRDLFTAAISYQTPAEGQPTNLRLEAMKGLFDGSKALHIHVSNAKSIIESVTVAKSYGVKRIVVVGGEQAHLITSFLKDNNVPVILTGIHELPAQDHEDTVLPFKLPKMLYDAGVTFGISNGGGYADRNLGFATGTAVAHGLPYDQGIHAITGGMAKILGIDQTVGTLEQGKDATLFVSSGDALDMRGNNVELAFIMGKNIQINARQQFLYKKYADKYEQPVNLVKEKN